MTIDNVVVFKGIPRTRLSQRLITQKGLTQEYVDLIKMQHVRKLEIFDLMQVEISPKVLKELATKVTRIEFELQKLWGFPLDKNYHRFWEVPACICPAMDNYDRYPTGYYVINSSCPVHGNADV